MTLPTEGNAVTSQKTAELGSATSSVKPIDSHTRFIVVGVIVGIGINLGTKAAKNNDAYWNAHINCDGEALAELCPDSFWDYISDTYDLSEEDAVAAMNQYMQDYSDTLGGDLSYKNGTEWRNCRHGQFCTAGSGAGRY